MTQPIETSPKSSGRRRALTLLVCLVIIAVGVGIGQYLKVTAPKAQKRPPEKSLPKVETLALRPVEHRVSIDAMGSVVPAREMVLKSRVSGQVQLVHPEFIAGGIVTKGQRLVKIDPQDYRLALARKESDLINAQYELKVEMGYQEVARKEWTLLNKGQSSLPDDEELALRKPHLAKARSDVAAARAELEQARLDLARTDVAAPFNAVIRSTNVEVGSQISTQDSLAELVGTDEYWIRVSLPVERLGWFAIPTDDSGLGAPVQVRYRGYQRSGRVIRLLSDLETQGRMARIVVAVKDPLGLKARSPDRPSLLIGEYVRVEIQGRLLTGVYRIPRSSLRDNDTIWLAGKGDTLRIEPVDILWRDDRIVLVKNNLQPDDRLVVSDLVTPVQGMPLDVLVGDIRSSGEQDGNG
jgi:RND family efflux transporter MFP subunit